MRRRLLLMLAALACACRGSEAPATDAGPADADQTGSGAPALPRFSDWPCPAGWVAERVAKGLEAEHSVCLPPAQAACPEGQVQFLGEAACHAIGAACPAGDFLDASAIRKLAPDFHGKLLYVRPGANGGDGSLAAPLGTVAQALAAASAGDLIALAKASFKEQVVVAKAVALVGACVGGTTIAPDMSGDMLGLVRFDVGGGRLANLRLSGASVGLHGRNLDGPITARAVEVLRARTLGIYFAKGSRGGTLEEMVVRSTEPHTGDGEAGNGMMLMPGPTVRLERAVFERNLEVGVAIGAGATAELVDVVVRDTESNAAHQDFGRGLLVQDGGKVKVTRGLFERNREFGISASKPGTTVELSDVAVRDTRSLEATATDGIGIEVLNGATASVRRAVLERNRTVGVTSYATQGGAPPSLTLEDVVIRDTRSQEKDQAFGIGVQIGGGSASLSRVLLERDRETGIFISINEQAPSTPPGVELADVLVRDTESNSQGQYGRGLEIQEQAVVGGTRIWLEGNREVGLFIGVAETPLAGASPSYALADVTIRNTRPESCAEIPEGQPLSCRQGEIVAGGGSGLVVVDGARLDLRSFAIATSAMCGIQVARGGQVAAATGEIRDNVIGLNAGADYDLSSILNDTVRFVGNESNLVSDALPVPTLKR